MTAFPNFCAARPTERRHDRDSSTTKMPPSSQSSRSLVTRAAAPSLARCGRLAHKPKGTSYKTGSTSDRSSAGFLR
jgi:hypothetical protein